MQVLNSPSRGEVDKAHTDDTWLGIGVPSVRNAFRVSRFKTISWVVLLLSSIPVHLLTNSTVFQTDQRRSDFHLTIANEGFVDDAKFYPPGASLFQAGGYDTAYLYDGPDVDAAYGEHILDQPGYGYGGVRNI
jgi:hypothetical protein